jgi:hypothetical protein
MRLSVADLASGKTTYRNRYGRSYVLRTKCIQGSKVEMSYEITHGAAKRIVRRIFPGYIEVNGRLLWILGLLKGEGLSSVGSRSSMYRFCVVNNDPSVIRAVMRVLDDSGLEPLARMRTRCGLIRISYGPHCDKQETKEFWARELGLGNQEINLARNSERQKRAIHGSCMLTLSDVLLRRVFDLVAEKVYNNLFLDRLGQDRFLNS